jgi:hypothetical protein
MSEKGRPKPDESVLDSSYLRYEQTLMPFRNMVIREKKAQAKTCIC